MEGGRRINEYSGSFSAFFHLCLLASSEISKVTMRYRLHRDLVLRGIDLKIPSRSKLAFCGRTGCGKSSLFSVLPCLAEQFLDVFGCFWYEKGEELSTMDCGGM